MESEIWKACSVRWRSNALPADIGNIHERLQIFDIQFGVPHFATQLA